MPHRFYHGRTAKVFNINPRSVGLLMWKKVNGRYVKKHLHVRLEHVRKSNVRTSLVKRF
jgi:large subunit ribosomal protein L21e